MALTHKDVAEILKIIDESGVDELVVDNDGLKITLVRSAREAVAPVRDAPAGARTAPRAAMSSAHSGAAEVIAPMAGVFYRKPSPEEPPFVEIGDKVSLGDSLALIEMMKLFTTVEAPVAGEIIEIAYDDAAMVEQDAVLFVIAPVS